MCAAYLQPRYFDATATCFNHSGDTEMLVEKIAKSVFRIQTEMTAARRTSITISDLIWRFGRIGVHMNISVTAFDDIKLTDH